MRKSEGERGRDREGGKDRDGEGSREGGRESNENNEKTRQKMYGSRSVEGQYIFECNKARCSYFLLPWLHESLLSYFPYHSTLPSNPLLPLLNQVTRYVYLVHYYFYSHPHSLSPPPPLFLTVYTLCNQVYRTPPPFSPTISHCLCNYLEPKKDKIIVYFSTV